ncbi:MAG: hypothetical protein IPK12_05950 [Gemmatimonadetes bacterium]|nr:hypothetical protein [Gemmatimonadota bacterium]
MALPFVLAAPLGAQQVAPPVPAEMRALAFLEGRWEGTGHMGAGERRAEARTTEVVRFRADTGVVVIEGRGVARGPDDQDIVVHQAFGVLWYDRPAGRYRLRTFRRGGESLEPDITVGDHRLAWEFTDPRAGRIRFEIDVRDQVWRERGAYSADGTTWTPFFEMVLQRVGPAE